MRFFEGRSSQTFAMALIMRSFVSRASNLDQGERECKSIFFSILLTWKFQVGTGCRATHGSRTLSLFLFEDFFSFERFDHLVVAIS